MAGDGGGGGEGAGEKPYNPGSWKTQAAQRPAGGDVGLQNRDIPTGCWHKRFFQSKLWFKNKKRLGAKLKENEIPYEINHRTP